jgi:hypothetical protein
MFTIEQAYAVNAGWPDHSCSCQPQTAPHGGHLMFELIPVTARAVVRVELPMLQAAESAPAPDSERPQRAA